ncbi:MAG: peptidoglycan-binding protein [Terrimicrobiaceae bacterium]|nr:peptidoglycan-binding protein [Terrimicrobiaceae bacterium]
MRTLSLAVASLFCLGLLEAGQAQESPSLREVQARLKAMGFYRGEVDGAPGSQTAAAIRRYQLANNLRVTGEMNPQTAASLGFAVPAVPDSPAPANDLFSGGPLAGASEERRREVVRKVQAFLAREGFSAGPADGVPGPQTLAALRAWQRRVGIPFKGRLDSATLSRMGIKGGGLSAP